MPPAVEQNAVANFQAINLIWEGKVDRSGRIGSAFLMPFPRHGEPFRMATRPRDLSFLHVKQMSKLSVSSTTVLSSRSIDSNSNHQKHSSVTRFYYVSSFKRSLLMHLKQLAPVPSLQPAGNVSCGQHFTGNAEMAGLQSPECGPCDAAPAWQDRKTMQGMCR